MAWCWHGDETDLLWRACILLLGSETPLLKHGIPSRLLLFHSHHCWDYVVPRRTGLGRQALPGLPHTTCLHVSSRQKRQEQTWHFPYSPSQTFSGLPATLPRHTMGWFVVVDMGGGSCMHVRQTFFAPFWPGLCEQHGWQDGTLAWPLASPKRLVSWKEELDRQQQAFSSSSPLHGAAQAPNASACQFKGQFCTHTLAHTRHEHGVLPCSFLPSCC